MTISVTVHVPEKANCKAKVDYIDKHHKENDALAGIVPPGSTETFYATNERKVSVIELPLDDNDK
jgi:hypothetical protein